MLITRNLHKKGSEVSIKTRSPPASLSFKGQATKHTIVKWSIEHLSSYAHVVHTTVKQVISRRGKNENVCEMSKTEKCTCKACKTICFSLSNKQICDALVAIVFVVA